MEYIKKLYPLVVIATVFGGLLALTYGGLKPLLEGAKRKEFEQSLRNVYPSFSRYKEKTIEDKTYYILYEGDTIVAYVFRATYPGYGGPVETLTAVTNGIVARVVVMDMSGETPGLGTKAKEEQWLSQFVGRNVEGIPTTKPDFKAKGCDVISGATLSSVAVTRGIYEALALYAKLVGNSGEMEKGSGKSEGVLSGGSR